MRIIPDTLPSGCGGCSTAPGRHWLRGSSTITAKNMTWELARAIGRIPCGLLVPTAAYDGARSGVLAKWVQQCAAKPPMLMVAPANDLPIATLIRDSRSFALCQISADDRFLQRKFASTPDQGEDPFVTLTTAAAPSGSPIVQRALSNLDCELIRHIDLESDYGLHVGRVRHGGMLNSGTPLVLMSEDDLLA